jgi:hypothetical protein
MALPRSLDGECERGYGAPVGGNHRAADGLQGAKQNNLRRRLRRAAESRADDKEQKAGSVKTPPAEKIAQAADRNDQANEREIVDQQHPLDGCQAGVEGMGQRRQCHQKRALIQAHDELPDANIH